MRYSFLILLLLIFLFTSCTIPRDDILPSRILHRSLNNSELLYNSWKYQPLKSTYSIACDYTAPTNIPSVEWYVKENIKLNSGLIVDSNGHTWFLKYTQSNISDKILIDLKAPFDIVKLSKEGSVLLSKSQPSYQMYPPIALTKNVIIFINHEFRESINHLVSLECVDLDLNTLWRTEPATAIYSEPGAWRISNNRIMMPVSHGGSSLYNTYAMSDGALLNQLALNDFVNKINNKKPRISNSSFIKAMEIDSGGWIQLKSDTLTCYTEYLEPIWEYNINNSTFSLDLFTQVLVSSNGQIAISTYDEFELIEIQDGSIVKSELNSILKQTRVAGVNSSGDVLIYSTNDPTMKNSQSKTVNSCFYSFKAINKDGSAQWSNSIEEFQYMSAVVVYSDGKILYSHSNSISLVGEDGVTIWEINIQDLEIIPDNARLCFWQILPAPDGRIVCTFNDNLNQNMNESYIVSLG